MFHTNLIKHMNAQGYKVPSQDRKEEGRCFGHAHMGKFAILLGEQGLKDLSERMDMVNKETLPSPLPLNIKAYFDGVSAYQHTYMHPEIAGETHHQNPNTIDPIMLPIDLEKVGGITNISQFNGVYSLSELTLELSKLSELIKENELKKPVAIVLSNMGHSISIGYDPIKETWSLIDANYDSIFEFSSEKEMSEKIFKSLQSGDNKSNSLMMSGEIYVRNDELIDYKDAISSWINSEKRKIHHKITPEKAGIRNQEGHSYIHLAAATNSLDTIKKILDSKLVDINTADLKGRSPLIIAVSSGNTAVVKELLLRGANVNQETTLGETPLLGAVLSGTIDIVKTLISAGAEVNKKTTSGVTPLLAAIVKGSADMLKTLLSAYKDLKEVDLEEDSGIPFIIYKKAPFYLEKMNLLLSTGKVSLEKKLSLNGKKVMDAYYGQITTLDYLIKEDNVDTALLLMSHGADIGQSVKYIDNAHSKIFDILIDKTHEGDFALIKGAIMYGNEKKQILTILLNNGINPNISREKDNATAMHFVAQSGNLDLMKILVEHGAKTNVQTLDGTTPLHIAASKGYDEIADFLIKSNPSLINMPRKKSDGATALFLAAQEGHEKTVELLCQKGADINQARKDGVTPLFIAVQKGDVSMVKKLLSLGANSQISCNGKTALDVAREMGLKEIENLLYPKKPARPILIGQQNHSTIPSQPMQHTIKSNKPYRSG